MSSYSYLSVMACFGLNLANGLRIKPIFTKATKIVKIEEKPYILENSLK